jgi:competence protein ComEC
MVFSVAPLLSIVIHPLSPLCNLILLPILYFFIVPLSFVSVVISPLERVADQAISLFYTIVETIARWLELIPSYSMPTAMVGALSLLAVSVLLIQRDLPVRTKILASAVVVVFFYGAAQFVYQKQAIEGIRLSAIDIGQGDGFTLGWGKSKILVDGGSDAAAWKKLAPTLVREGSRPLNLWVLTHFDRDHGGGFAEISRNIPFDSVWIPKFDRKKFPRTNSRALPFDENRELSFCDGRYCLIPWMDPQQYGENQSVTNDSSLVLLLIDRVTNVLIGVFLGDLEAKGEKKFVDYLHSARWKIPAGGIQLLKVGHHGSRSSSTEALLALLRPELAIILCGRHNQYGHPHDEVIRRLQKYVGAVLRTDSIGDFEVSF